MSSSVTAFLADGVPSFLSEGQSKVFGRADYHGAERAQNVSRRQFALSVVGGSLRVRSLSAANHTKVLRAGQPPLVLAEGEQTVLRPGDDVLLHALDHAHCISIVHGRQQLQQADGVPERQQQAEGVTEQQEQASGIEQAEEHRPKRPRPAGSSSGGNARASQTAAEADTQEAAPVAGELRGLGGAAVAIRPVVAAVPEETGGHAPMVAAPPAQAASGPSSATTLAPVSPEAAKPSAAVQMEVVPAAPAESGPGSDATLPLARGMNVGAQQHLGAGDAAAAVLGGSQPSQPGLSILSMQPSSSEDASGPVPAVVLLLVGVQGSGKSTFSNRLIGASELQWVRINQDSVNCGKRGNREMCISLARSVLEAGRNVIIDRTNIDPAQRQPFIELARQCGAKAHCVVLRLPLRTCQARAAGREKHEGGLKGKAAYAAVNIMHSNYMKAGPPSEAEGLKTILMCENDEEVDAALRAWAGYGSAHRNPLGAWRQLAPPKKAPLTEADEEKKGVGGKGKGSGGSKGPAVKPGGPGSIESFFKKKAAPAKEGQGTAQQGQAAQQGGAGAQEQRVAARAKDALGPRCEGKAPVQEEAPRAAQKGAGSSQQAQQQQQVQQVQAPGQPSQQQRQQQPMPPASQPQGGLPGGSVAKGNALHWMMEKAKEKKPPATASAPPAAATAAAAAGPSQPTCHTFPTGSPALKALMDVVAHPERQASDSAYAADDLCVRICDKYPKARFHALVIAKDPRLQGPLDLRRQDVPLVQHMVAVGRQWAEQQVLEGGGGRPDFFFGFHSVPSMRQLHLHVISQDLVSPSLKNTKHWNSFNGPFFLHASWVLAQLEQRGQLGYDLREKEELLKAPLKCHRCGAGAPTMPQLKSHVAACRAPVRGAGT